MSSKTVAKIEKSRHAVLWKIPSWLYEKLERGARHDGIPVSVHAMLLLKQAVKNNKNNQ